MLKKEVIVSEQLKRLSVMITNYSDRFISPLFRDTGKGEIINSYEEDKVTLQMMVKSNSQDNRAAINTKLLKELELCIQIGEILTNNTDWRLNPGIISKTITQINKTNATVEEIMGSDNLFPKMIDEYYDNVLNLLIYLNAIRASISTLEKVSDKFGVNNETFILLFSKLNGEHFTITQQKEIVTLIDEIFTRLFGEYEDSFTFELDTGSPSISFIIKINMGEIFDLFKAFFEYIRNRKYKEPNKLNELERYTKFMLKQNKNVYNDDIKNVKMTTKGEDMRIMLREAFTTSRKKTDKILEDHRTLFTMHHGNKKITYEQIREPVNILEREKESEQELVTEHKTGFIDIMNAKKQEPPYQVQANGT